MVTIRKFKSEDGETVAEIANEAFEEEIAKGMPRFTAENVVESSQRHGVNVFVAEEGGLVAGFITLVESRMGYPAQIHLVGGGGSLEEEELAGCWRNTLLSIPRI